MTCKECIHHKICRIVYYNGDDRVLENSPCKFFKNKIDLIKRSEIMKEGWICPRCKKVNAPFIPSCDCQENDYTNYVKQVDCINGYHQWECISVGTGTAGVTYRCRACGKTITDNYDVNKSPTINL